MCLGSYVSEQELLKSMYKMLKKDKMCSKERAVHSDCMVKTSKKKIVARNCGFSL